MALKIVDFGSKEYKQTLALRTDVLRKPLGLHFSEEELQHENDYTHIAAYEDDKLLGCCMLVKKDDGTIRLRQMAVLNNLQGKGVGRALIQFAENIARDMGYKKITMHARKQTVGFFEKLDYQVIGSEFVEITIPHYKMEKALV